MADEVEVFVATEEALTAVLRQVRDEQWGMPIPAWFPVGGGDRAAMTVDSLVRHHAQDDAWVPDVLAGRTAAEVGDRHDGDLLAGDPEAKWDAIVEKACAAARSATLDATVHLSYGDWPAREYLQHISTFRGLRAHDFARLVGVPEPLSDELVADLWAIVEPAAEQWRSWGVFGPAVAVPADAPLLDRLLGITGRDPAAGLA